MIQNQDPNHSSSHESIDEGDTYKNSTQLMQRTSTNQTPLTAHQMTSLQSSATKLNLFKQGSMNLTRQQTPQSKPSSSPLKAEEKPQAILIGFEDAGQDPFQHKPALKSKKGDPPKKPVPPPQVVTITNRSKSAKGSSATANKAKQEPSEGMSQMKRAVIILQRDLDKGK